MRTIDTKIIENIGIIYFNRPDKLNSFNAQMGCDYNKALQDMACNDDIIVLVNRIGLAVLVGGVAWHDYAVMQDEQQGCQ